MATARHQLVEADAPGTYHCWSRCVRRALLCGEGYEHRKQWIRDRIRELADIFALEVCAYAVMSNHLHLVLRLDPDRARHWSHRELARRYVRLFPWSCGVRNRRSSEQIDDAVDRLRADAERLALARERLSSLSWFMSCLNEPIARRANREDQCTGRFWEERFKSRRLLDEGAVLSAMVYVDLNPIRAGLATTPEASDYTSVQERIRQCRRGAEAATWLAPFQSASAAGGLLDMELDEYLQIVDGLGRTIVAPDKGAIPAHLAPILERLELDPDRWTRAMTTAISMAGSAIGSTRRLAEEAARRGRRWIVGAMPVYRIA